MKNTRIAKIFNENYLLINAGFRMTPKYETALLERLEKAEIILPSAKAVVSEILRYKHDEKNPFPSMALLGKVLDKSRTAIDKGVKSFKDAGLVIVTKEGRKSVYDFRPFQALLSKVTHEFENGNFDIDLEEIMKVKVEKVEVEKEVKAKKTGKVSVKKVKETVVVGTFDYLALELSMKELQAEATTKYTSTKAGNKVEGNEEGKKQEGKKKAEKPAEQPSVNDVVLPSAIEETILEFKIDEAGINAIKNSYARFKGKLVDELFLEKITYSIVSKDFVNYYNKCIANAVANNEQPKQVKHQNKQQQTGFTPVRTEIVPDWLGKEQQPSEVDDAEQQRLAEAQRKMQVKYADKHAEKHGVTAEEYINAYDYSKSNETSIEEAIAVVLEIKELKAKLAEKY